MNRLTRTAEDFDYCRDYCLAGDCQYKAGIIPEKCLDARLYERLRDYEDAEAEGRLLILPCTVGDTVYRICHEYKKGNPFIRAVTFNQNNFWRIVFSGEFGKTVFLTPEEAKAALMGGADG